MAEENINPTQPVMPTLPVQPPKNEQQEKDKNHNPKKNKHDDDATPPEKPDRGLFDEYV